MQERRKFSKKLVQMVARCRKVVRVARHRGCDVDDASGVEGCRVKRKLMNNSEFVMGVFGCYVTIRI